MSTSETSIFIRKATGLVRSWSVFDAFIYAFFSINLITLGLYSFSQMYYFGGGMIPALIISAIFSPFFVTQGRSRSARYCACRRALILTRSP